MKSKLKSVNLSRFSIYIAFVAIFIVLSIISPNFLTPSNMLNIMRQVSFNGMLALGLTFVIMTGGIDLSVGSTLAFSGILAASFSVESAALALPLPLAVLIGLAASALIGLANGLMVTKGNVPPFVATMVTMMVVRGAAQVFTNGRPIIGYTEEYQRIGQGSVAGIPIPVILYFFLILISVLLLHYAKFGRHVYAVGGNPLSAKASGLSVNRIVIATYIISGLMAGFCGIALSSRVNAASPISGEGYETDAIAAAVIGGTSLAGGVGSIPGSIVGAFIIGVLTNGLDIMNVSSYYQKIIKGLIILIAVLSDRKRDR